MKNCIPSLVDVVLTNQKNKCFNIQNFPTGISDCHNSHNKRGRPGPEKKNKNLQKL
jgi:hypothetical protein